MSLFLKTDKRRFIFKNKLKMTPTVFLSLFLIFTITLLTGMCTIFPKKKVLIYDGKEKIGHIHSNNEENLNFCVNEYLKAMGKEIKAEDITKLEKLSNGNYEFKINRGFKVDLDLFGKEKEVYLKQNQTVEDLLKKLKIETTDPKIHTNLDFDTVLKEDDFVKIQSCEVKTKNEKFETVDLPEEHVDDLKLEKGKMVVLSNPVPQKIKKYVECKYVNGDLVGEKQKEEIVQKGVPKKIAFGKKEINKEKPVNGKQQQQPKKPEAKKGEVKKAEAKKAEKENPNAQVTGKKVLCGYSTAYVAKGRTARMGPARFGVVAVNPKVIPYGTKLFIEGYGHCVAGDMCGAACRGKVLVDVCFNTPAQCKAWGKRKVKIHIL